MEEREGFSVPRSFIEGEGGYGSEMKERWRFGEEWGDGIGLRLYEESENSYQPPLYFEVCVAATKIFILPLYLVRST